MGIKSKFGSENWVSKRILNLGLFNLNDDANDGFARARQ